MNWMTSGRHRAMYSKHGRRRQKMHFPIAVQQERLDQQLHHHHHHHHPRVESESKGHEQQQPWYQLDFENQEESLDVQILEFGAMTGKQKPTVYHEKVQEKSIRDNVFNRNEESPVKKCKENERCVFTPVKNTKKPFKELSQHQTKTHQRKIHSSHDILLINEGTEVSHSHSIIHPTNQIHSVPQLPIESVSFQPNQSTNKLSTSNHFTASTYKSNDKIQEKPRARFTPPNTCYSTNRMEKFPEEASFHEPEESTSSLSMMFPAEQERLLSPIPFVLSSQEETSPSPTFAPKKKVMTTLPSANCFELAVPEDSDKLLFELPPVGWKAKAKNQIEEDILNQLIQAPSQDLQSSTLITTNTPFALSISSIEGSQRSHLSSEDDLIPPPGMIDLFKESLKTGKLKIQPIQKSLCPISEEKRKLIPMLPAEEKSSSEVSPRKRQKITSWRMSSRTAKLFHLFHSTTTSSDHVAPSSSISTHSKYLQMESVAVYMSTIIQCYKINEQLAKEIKIKELLEEPKEKQICHKA